jgi:hypothetical protein
MINMTRLLRSGVGALQKRLLKVNATLRPTIVALDES